MKTYRSHKIVQAAKIISATRGGDGKWTLGLEGGYIVTLDQAVTARYEPQAGDYLVKYPPDDYLSISPGKTFEDGYTEIVSRDEGMTFGQALEQVKRGAKVARAGWNGKGMYIALQPGSVIRSDQARGGVALELSKEGKPEIVILPHIDMKSAQGDVVVGWLASQTDMLATDWAIVL
jgi:hypothetical protein